MLKKINLLLIVIFSILSNQLISQVVGKCLDKNGKPIPFLNVAVVMTNIGTVTDENGFFILKGDFNNDLDSLKISHIGYKTQTLSLNRNDTIIVTMQPTEHQLKEVTIIPVDESKLKEKIIGTKAPSGHIAMGFKSKNLGGEIGKLIEIKKGRTHYIEKIMFHVSTIDYQSVKFRFNFYRKNSNDEIEMERINFKDIIKEVMNTGLHEVDIMNEQLKFSDDFLITIEWIDYVDLPIDKLNAVLSDPAKKGQRQLYFNCDVFCGPIYYRSTSQQKWKDHKHKYNTCLGIHLLTKYSNE